MSKNLEHLKKNSTRVIVTSTKEKMYKWVSLCCTVVVKHVIMDVLYLNSMINHSLQKIILSKGVLSS